MSQTDPENISVTLKRALHALARVTSDVTFDENISDDEPGVSETEPATMSVPLKTALHVIGRTTRDGHFDFERVVDEETGRRRDEDEVGAGLPR